MPFKYFYTLRQYY